MLNNYGYYFSVADECVFCVCFGYKFNPLNDRLALHSMTGLRCNNVSLRNLLSKYRSSIWLFSLVGTFSLVPKCKSEQRNRIRRPERWSSTHLEMAYNGLTSKFNTVVVIRWHFSSTDLLAFFRCCCCIKYKSYKHLIFISVSHVNMKWIRLRSTKCN